MKNIYVYIAQATRIGRSRFPGCPAYGEGAIATHGAAATAAYN